MGAYLTSVWDLLRDLWLYMLIGFVVAGVVEEFVSEGRLLRYFGANDLASLLRATLAGFAVSACSCGAIPLAASLRNRGASTATTLTFLLASPWLGIPMLLVYVKFLGWVNTGFLIVLSISVALCAGVVLARLERRGAIAGGEAYDEFSLEKQVVVRPDLKTANTKPATSACCDDGSSSADNGARSSLSMIRRMGIRVPRHAWDLGKDIAPYLLLGMLLAAIPRAFVDAETVASWMGVGAGVFGVLIALPVSAVIEACSEGFAVVSGQLYQQGASLAVVFVMTMVGVATDYTELAVVWKKFGQRTALTYLGIGTSLTVLVGVVLQLMLGWVTG